MTYITHLSHRARGVFYGWWLVGISSFIRTSSVPLFHAMGLWFVALEAQFGWNRTQLSLAFAFTRVESGLLGPVEGYLTDRIGTRRLVFIGLLVMGAGFLLFGQVNHLWVFYVAFLVMALGQGLSGRTDRVVWEFDTENLSSLENILWAASQNADFVRDYESWYAGLTPLLESAIVELWNQV